MLSRWLVSLLLLTLLIWWLGPQALWAQLHGLDVRWLVPAIALGVFQVLLSAWRWRLTAHAMGLALSMRQAIEEYYLGTLLNQVLPGGVIGDAYRAKRHSDLMTKKSPAWFAVIIERFSGQAALALITVIVLVSSSTWQQAIVTVWSDMDTSRLWLMTGGLLVLLLVLVLGSRWVVRQPRLRVWVADFYKSLGQVFWPLSRLLKQASSSVLIVASYISVFVLAAWAVGIEASFFSLAILAPPLLLAMIVPVTVSGWGVREWVAVGTWGLMGLEPTQGAAVSVAYGLMIFINALPGALMWRQRSSQVSL